MENFTRLHAKALYLRFCAIYDHKFYKPYHDDADFKPIWYAEWASGLVGIDVGLIKGCLEYCKMNLEWPPSIAEFRRICEQQTGVPSVEEALRLAVRREFTHPIVALAFEKVGSWAMRTDTHATLLPKFTSAYHDALNSFRKDSVNGLKAIEHDKRTMDSEKEPMLSSD